VRNASVSSYSTSGVTRPWTSGITDAAISADPSRPSSASSRLSASAITIVAPITHATADTITRLNSSCEFWYE
jgi:hypothetical protein